MREVLWMLNLFLLGVACGLIAAVWLRAVRESGRARRRMFREREMRLWKG